MTHHSFAVLRITGIVGVAGAKRAKRGAAGERPYKDPSSVQVRKALRRLDGMKLGRFELRKVKIKYKKLPAKSAQRKTR
jgi:hypothetical protein